MRLYIFKSDANAALRAFTGDVLGTKLPDQFRPWQAVGIIAPANNPPHNLSREKIEKAIEACGFQLWRLKPEAEVGVGPEAKPAAC
jgi:hypothetical protein